MSCLEGLGRDLLLCLFQLLKGTHIPWFIASRSVFKVSNSGLSPSYAAISASLLPPSFPFSNTCAYIGPTLVSWDSLPIVKSAG